MEELDREGESLDLLPEEVEAHKIAIRKIWDLNRMEEIS